MNPIRTEQVAPHSKEVRINQVLSMIDEQAFKHLTHTFQEMFGLEYETITSLPHHVKCLINCKNFKFIEGLSYSSKAFMILHTLGHYYFISSADEKKVNRFNYLYEIQGAKISLLEPREVTEKIIRDRTAFEIGANYFAVELLHAIGLSHLAPIVTTYQSGDINYILDVTGGGKDVIVPTDYDYLDKYVCNNCTVQEEADEHHIFEKEKFHPENINWEVIFKLNLEINFY